MLTDYPEPVRGAAFEPRHGEFYVFAKDAGGNEVFRAYRRDFSGAAEVPITPEGQRVQSMAWSEHSGQIVLATVPVNRQGSNDKVSTTLSIMDPTRPESARTLAELPGGGWFGFEFSPDGKQLAYVEYI